MTEIYGNLWNFTEIYSGKEMENDAILFYENENENENNFVTCCKYFEKLII